jgi:predicted dehydrogenase
LTGEEPTEIVAMSYSTPNDVRFKEVEETISFQLRFPSGVVASCVSTYGFGCNRYRVIGTKGVVEQEPFLNYDGDRLYQGRGPRRQEVQIEPANHFACEMDHFAQCVLNDQPPLTQGDEGLRDLKYMMAAYESARTGKTIQLG